MSGNCKTALAYIATMICVGVGFVVAVAGDEYKYETGVVRAKKDSALYIVPLSDTLVGRKIQFTGDPVYKRAYDITNVGDTVKFYNPGHEIDIPANPSYAEARINGKDLLDAEREFDKNKQLQQIQMESRQK